LQLVNIAEPVICDAIAYDETRRGISKTRRRKEETIAFGPSSLIEEETGTIGCSKKGISLEVCILSVYN